jgi:hypothetical protein
MDTGYVRVDNITSYAYVGDGIGGLAALSLPGNLCPSGCMHACMHACCCERFGSCCPAQYVCSAWFVAAGDQAAEKFIAYDPANPGGTSIVVRGQTIVLVSVQVSKPAVIVRSVQHVSC